MCVCVYFDRVGKEMSEQKAHSPIRQILSVELHKGGAIVA